MFQCKCGKTFDKSKWLIDDIWYHHPDEFILPISQWRVSMEPVAVDITPAKAALPEHPKDVCECGDYREQHHNNGACKLNGLGHGLPFSLGKCLQFRLSLSIYVVNDNGEDYIK